MSVLATSPLRLINQGIDDAYQNILPILPWLCALGIALHFLYALFYSDGYSPDYSGIRSISIAAYSNF